MNLLFVPSSAMSLSVLLDIFSCCRTPSTKALILRRDFPIVEIRATRKNRTLIASSMFAHSARRTCPRHSRRIKAIPYYSRYADYVKVSRTPHNSLFSPFAPRLSFGAITCRSLGLEINNHQHTARRDSLLYGIVQLRSVTYGTVARRRVTHFFPGK